MKHYLPYLYLISCMCAIVFFEWFRQRKYNKIMENHSIGQDMFDEVTSNYKIGDEILTVEAQELPQFGNPSKPTAHYHGTLLGIDNELREIHVALYGMGISEVTDKDAGGKYVIEENGKKYNHEWISLPLNQVLCNEPYANDKIGPAINIGLNLLISDAIFGDSK